MSAREGYGQAVQGAPATLRDHRVDRGTACGRWWDDPPTRLPRHPRENKGDRGVAQAARRQSAGPPEAEPADRFLDRARTWVRDTTTMPVFGAPPEEIAEQPVSERGGQA